MQTRKLTKMIKNVRRSHSYNVCDANKTTLKHRSESYVTFNFKLAIFKAKFAFYFHSAENAVHYLVQILLIRQPKKTNLKFPFKANQLIIQF